jgi:hypothetical protein
MFKLRFFVFIILFSLSLATAIAAQPCATIQSSMIVDTNNNVITVGYDKYGYNYQAHNFNGLYENYRRPATVVTEGAENLVMKWSDNWLANVSCDGVKLTRGYNAKTDVIAGYSMGWVTNHFEGDYLGSDGEFHHYTYSAKIVYDGGAACNVGNISCIWGLYAIAEEHQNDLFGEYGGRKKFVNKLTGPGLGLY